MVVIVVVVVVAAAVGIYVAIDPFNVYRVRVC